MKAISKILLILSFNVLFSETYVGYLRTTEASFCMDQCSEYMLEGESGEFITNLTSLNEIYLSYFINRYVDVEGELEWECIECTALIIDNIAISTDCDNPVFCFADPCEVAGECQINTPVECISNYCGGCYADFYDLDQNLVDCYAEFHHFSTSLPFFYKYLLV